MAGKGSHGMLFRELKPDQLASLRNQLGLKEWVEPVASTSSTVSGGSKVDEETLSESTLSR